MQDIASSFLFFNRLSEQLVCVFSVDKLITDHLPRICILLFFCLFVCFFTERAWSNLLASADERYCFTWSIQTDRMQISTELKRWLLTTIRHYSRLLATIRTIRDYSHYSYYSLLAIRYSGLPDTRQK